MSTDTNGSTAKTIKEMVLELERDTKTIRTELDKAKGALYLAVLLGLVNVLDTVTDRVIPAIARASGQ